MKEISFTVKYEAGHSYNERWLITDYHCPKCGVKNVWVNDSSGGDFYVGEEHRCNNCSSCFYLPNGVNNPTDWQAEQRTEAFKEPS